MFEFEHSDRNGGASRTRPALDPKLREETRAGRWIPGRGEAWQPRSEWVEKAPTGFSSFLIALGDTRRWVDGAEKRNASAP